MAFCDNLRIARERACLSPAELAAQLQLPERVIRQWEWGELQPPVQMLPRLLDCLHITLEELAWEPPVSESAAVLAPQPEKVRKFPTVKQTRTWKTVGILLFVANFLTIFWALWTVGGISARNQLFVENMWVFFLFTPIPLASIVVGILMRRRGLGGLKNIIAGGIFLFLLCMYGAFTPIFGAVEAEVGQTPEEQAAANAQRLQQAEMILGEDLPEPEQMTVDTFTAYYPAQGDLQCTNVFFDAAAMREFEQQLMADDRWFTTPPTLLKGFFPESYPFTASADYKLLYNADLDQYNAIPDQGGAYRYFLLCYNAGSDTMQIYEYDLRYIPQ